MATPGYYTTPLTDPVTLRWGQSPCPQGLYCTKGAQRACPPGRFGGSSGLFSQACSGPCAPGYYCSSGSWTQAQHECGTGLDVPGSVYCPAGSGGPTQALPGEKTVGGGPSTRSATVPCPSGSYCLEGESSSCPAGKFGCADRLSSEDCNGPCSPGYHCPSGSRSSQAYVHFTVHYKQRIVAHDHSACRGCQVKLADRRRFKLHIASSKPYGAICSVCLQLYTVKLPSRWGDHNEQRSQVKTGETGFPWFRVTSESLCAVCTHVPCAST
jgi:hypothetical protein